MKQHLRLCMFLASQLVVALAAASIVPARWRGLDAAAQLPPMLRSEPLAIQPLYDRSEIVSDAQLVKVLDRLQPRFAGDKPRINHVDHALRFWGIDAEFENSEALSGIAMRDLLVDHNRFASAWGDSTQPLLVVEPAGIRVRVDDSPAASSHVDHTLATLAEVGTPLHHPIIAPNSSATYRHMIEASLRNFSLNQVEHEWSGLTYALWLPPTRSWTTHEGQEITFDRLAQRSMRQPLHQGVCFGNHRLFELVAMLQIDKQHDILTDDTCSRILTHLHAASQVLSQNQREEGCWDAMWATPSGQADDSVQPTRLSDRLLATGHALEWLALAPQEVHPPSDTLSRAGQWLTETILSMNPGQIRDNYPFLSHAGRALALWRHDTPANAMRRR